MLEGSVQREGTRVRITAELIKVQDQSQLWSDSMEREMSGILALQNEVSQKVAGALALKLLPAEQARLANAPTVNPEAYEAYLRGSFHWMKATPGDLDIAEKYFDLSLEKDPSYAPAYAGRAWVWIVRNQIWPRAARGGGTEGQGRGAAGHRAGRKSCRRPRSSGFGQDMDRLGLGRRPGILAASPRA